MGSMMTGTDIWSGAGGLFLVVLLALTAIGVALLLWSTAAPTPRGGGAPGHDEAREILRRRYAGGEIDEDEFWRRMSGITAD
jgi:putative membrane protein